MFRHCLHTVSSMELYQTSDVLFVGPKSSISEQGNNWLLISLLHRIAIDFLNIVIHISQWILLLGQKRKEPAFDVDENLNQKISLWQGDITTLEIDAIVNAGMLYCWLLQKQRLYFLTLKVCILSIYNDYLSVIIININYWKIWLPVFSKSAQP